MIDYTKMVTAEDKEEQGKEQARLARNKLLEECDWTQIGDSPTNGDTDWLAYRQALRDITEQPGFPENIEWPEPPK